MDAKQVSNFLSENNIKATQAPFLNESKYLDALDQERKKKKGFRGVVQKIWGCFLAEGSFKGGSTRV